MSLHAVITGENHCNSSRSNFMLADMSNGIWGIPNFGQDCCNGNFFSYLSIRDSATNW